MGVTITKDLGSNNLSIKNSSIDSAISFNDCLSVHNNTNSTETGKINLMGVNTDDASDAQKSDIIIRNNGTSVDIYGLLRDTQKGILSLNFATKKISYNGTTIATSSGATNRYSASCAGCACGSCCGSYCGP